MPAVSNDHTFPPTQWDWIAQLSSQCDQEVRRALELLCQGYWFPTFGYLRSKGFDPEEAEDLTQDFFQYLLTHDFFSTARREKGRLRTYLLGALNNQVVSHFRAAQTQKRGGGHIHVPLHLAWAEQRYAKEPAHDETPDKLYNRLWWQLILDQAKAQLRAEAEAKDEGALLDALLPLLEARVENGSYRSIAAQHQISEQALRVRLSRLRKRMGQAVRTVLGRTVGSAEDVDAELATMLG